MLARMYARFRGSEWFLYTLCLAIAAVVFAHFAYGYDPDWGASNIDLSVESSISVALLMMAAEKQQRAEARRLEHMLHLLQAQTAALGALQALLEKDRASLPGQSP